MTLYYRRQRNFGNHEFIETNQGVFSDPAAERQFLPAHLCPSFILLQCPFLSFGPQERRKPAPDGSLLHRIGRLLLSGLRRHDDRRPAAFGKPSWDFHRTTGGLLRVLRFSFYAGLAAALPPRAAVIFHPCLIGFRFTANSCRLIRPAVCSCANQSHDMRNT